MERIGAWTFLCLCLLGCSGPEGTGAGTQPSSGAAPTLLDRTRAALENDYRLRPDRRFLLAVADVSTILTGDETAEAQAESSGGEWVVRCAGAEVGRMAGLPDFENALEMLSAWSKRLQKEHPLPSAPPGGQAAPESPLDQFPLVSPTDKLAETDRLWHEGRRERALLHCATQALVALTLQSLDWTEIADEVPARALAALAIERSLESPVPVEQALLAHALGYDAAARRAVQGLPPEHPVRAFLLQDDERLRQAAGAANALPLSRWLYLQRLIQQKQRRIEETCRREWFAGQQLTLPLLRLRLEAAEFGDRRVQGLVFPLLVLLEVERDARSPQSTELAANLRAPEGTPEELLAAADQILKKLAIEPRTLPARLEDEIGKLGAAGGPFLDAAVHQGAYRAILDSVWYATGLFYLDTLSSAEAAEKFAAGFGEPPPPPAADFLRWYRCLLGSKSGSAQPKAILSELDAPGHLGAPLLRRLHEEIVDKAPMASRLVLGASRRVARRLDSRPAHRRTLADIAFQLPDLPLAERLYESVLADPQSPTSLDAWYARYRGDDTRLREWLHAAELEPVERGRILEYFDAKGDMPAETLQREYRRLLDEAPDDWSLVTEYAKLLEGKKQYASAREVLGGWLRRNERAPNLDPVIVRARIAELFQLEGRYEEGWQVVEPVIQSWQGDAMTRGALLLAALGRESEAEALARAALGRYPDSAPVLAAAAEVCWRLNKPVEAAKILANPQQPTRLIDWGWYFGHGFARAFGPGPPEKALEAIRELKRLKIDDWKLHQLANAVASDGYDELSFTIQSRLRVAGFDVLEIYLSAYDSLRAWKGKDEALAWLRKTVSPGMLPPLSQWAWMSHEYDLVWDVVPDPKTQNEDADTVWLCRAASTLLDGGKRHDKWPLLVKHYQEASNRHYYALGRFLVGLEDDASVLRRATGQRKACEVACFVGLKAQAERRYVEAATWYRLALEIGTEPMAEYRWAFSELDSWQRKQTSLERLAAAGL
jgi:tetratricopeptide (TPR) repeat protein